MSSKVHPAPQNLSPDTIVASLAGFDSSAVEAFQQAFSACPAAVKFLNLLGYNQPPEKPTHDAAKLPPQLENFSILKESPSVAAALTNTAFIAAQLAVQETPHDLTALATLQEAVKPVVTIYQDAINVRISEDGIKITCRTVIVVGNRDFQGVYQQVWNLTVNADKDGVAQYAQVVKDLVVPEKAPRQITADVCVLFQHAAQIKDAYATFVTKLIPEGMSVDISIPRELKKMGRIIEKTILKRKDDPGNANKVCDIVRGMLTCDNMGNIADVLELLGTSRDIVVSRIKDRFLTAPSGGGWRDCMINFYLKNDPNQHICEIQLVHRQMMTARKGLPGHAVYNRVRNADEIVNQWMENDQPQTKEELEKWLMEWQKEKNEIIRDHPNTWDVTKITDMSKLFQSSQFNDDISEWDVSNVINMNLMFNDATSFNQPIFVWKTENVKDMNNMFTGAQAMEEKNKPKIRSDQVNAAHTREELQEWLVEWQTERSETSALAATAIKEMSTTMDAASIAELKKLNKPAHAVVVTMEAVCHLFGIKGIRIKDKETGKKSKQKKKTKKKKKKKICICD